MRRRTGRLGRYEPGSEDSAPRAALGEMGWRVAGSDLVESMLAVIKGRTRGHGLDSRVLISRDIEDRDQLATTIMTGYCCLEMLETLSRVYDEVHVIDDTRASFSRVGTMLLLLGNSHLSFYLRIWLTMEFLDDELLRSQPSEV